MAARRVALLFLTHRRRMSRGGPPTVSRSSKLLYHGNGSLSLTVGARPLEASSMNNIIYIIGLIVVVLAVLAFLGLR
jgi:small-conductance mechanosensitive channel